MSYARLKSVSLLAWLVLSLGSLHADDEPAKQTEEKPAATVDKPIEPEKKDATEPPPADAKPAEATEKKTEAPPPAKTTSDPIPAGRLPWEMPLTPPKLPGQKLQSVKEILQLLGIDSSQWRNFYQDRPFGTGEEEYINRVLFRMPRVGRESLFQFRQEKWDPAALIAAPSEHQGETLLLRGRAKHIKKVPLLEELLERFDFTHHYQIDFALNDHKHEAIVCVTSLPKAWPQEGPLDEPAEIEGVFVKSSPPPETEENGQTKLVFVANNIAWMPEKQDAKHGITTDVLALVKHGFDATSFDNIRHHNLKELTDQDREPFYQLLATLNKMPPDSPEFINAKPIDIAACLKSPDEQHGKFVSVLGSARRIDKIAIESTELQTRFGIDHYYELYVFVPLNEQRIKWARSATDPNPRLFDNNFPVTVCVKELPPGLKAAPKTHETVQFTGAILKVWSYRPQGEGNDLVQPSPMVLGSTVSLVEIAKPTDSLFTKVILGIMLVGLAGLMWAMFGQFSSTKTPRHNDPNVHFDGPKPPTT